MASSPSIELMTLALYEYTQGEVNAEISPRWRRQGDPLPYCTYEMSSANYIFNSNAMTNMATLTFSWTVVAQTLAECLVTADELALAFVDSFTQTNVTFRCVDLSMRTVDAIPDDGTGDAERIVVVSTSFLAHDES